MAGSLHIVAHIAVAADGAGVGSVTLLRAGGLRHDGLISVAGGLNGTGLAVLTVAAVMALLARFGAGGCRDLIPVAVAVDRVHNGQDGLRHCCPVVLCEGDGRHFVSSQFRGQRAVDGHGGDRLVKELLQLGSQLRQLLGTLGQQGAQIIQGLFQIQDGLLNIPGLRQQHSDGAVAIVDEGDVVHALGVDHIHELAVAVILNGGIQQLEACLGPGDDQRADRRTGAGEVAVLVPADEGSGHGIGTGLGGGLRAEIHLAPGVHASVNKGQLALFGSHSLTELVGDDHVTHSLGRAVVDVIAVMVLRAGAIHKGHIVHAGDHDDHAGDGLRIVHGGADVVDVGHLGVNAGQQLSLVFADDHIARGVQTVEEIGDLCGGLCAVGAVHIGQRTQIHHSKGVHGKDIVAVQGLGKGQLGLGDLGGNDQDACVHGGHIVRVGNDGEHQVDADVGAGRAVMEGQGNVCGELGDEAADGLHLLCREAQGLQLFHILVQHSNEVGCGNALCAIGGRERLVLLQDLIQALGEVHVDGASESSQTVCAEIALVGDPGSDDGQLGVGGGAVDHGGDVKGLAVVEMQGILHGHGSLGGQDRQSGHIDTHLQHFAVLIALDIDGDSGVEARVDGSRLRALEHIAVGRHAIVTDGKIFIRLGAHAVHQDVQSLCLTVKGAELVPVGGAGLIHEGDLDALGYHHIAAQDGHGVVQVIVPVQNVGKLHIGAELGHGGLLQHHGAVGQDAQILIADQGRGFCQGGCIQSLADCMGVHVELALLQGGQGQDAVEVVVVPGQIHLGGLRHDDQIADGRIGHIVGVRSHGAHQVNADVVRLQVAVDPDLHIRHLRHQLLQGGQCVVQERNGAAVKAQALQHSFVGLGQLAHGLHELTEGHLALEVVAQLAGQTDIHIAIHAAADVDAHHKVDGIDAGGIGGDAHTVIRAPGDHLRGHGELHGSLLHGDQDGGRAGTVGLVARIGQNDLICLIGGAQAHGAAGQGDRAAEGRTVSHDHGSDGGQQGLRAVTIGHGDRLVAGNAGSRAGIPEGDGVQGLGDAPLVVLKAELQHFLRAVAVLAEAMGIEVQVLQIRQLHLAADDLLPDLLQIHILDRGADLQPQLGQLHGIRAALVDDLSQDLDAGQLDGHGLTGRTGQIQHLDLALGGGHRGGDHGVKDALLGSSVDAGPEGHLVLQGKDCFHIGGVDRVGHVAVAAVGGEGHAGLGGLVADRRNLDGIALVIGNRDSLHCVARSRGDGHSHGAHAAHGAAAGEGAVLQEALAGHDLALGRLAGHRHSDLAGAALIGGVLGKADIVDQFGGHIALGGQAVALGQRHRHIQTLGVVLCGVLAGRHIGVHFAGADELECIQRGVHEAGHFAPVHQNHGELTDDLGISVVAGQGELDLLLAQIQGLQTNVIQFKPATDGLNIHFQANTFGVLAQKRLEDRSLKLIRISCI